MKLRTRVIVAGTRTFNDYNLLAHSLFKIFVGKDLMPQDVEIISGGADGADKLGEKFANDGIGAGMDIKLTVMPADWKRQGSSAGYIRNMEMANYARSNPDGVCICFWDGISDGTKSMIRLAEKAGLEVHVIRY